MKAVLPTIAVLLLAVPPGPAIAQEPRRVPPEAIESWSFLIGDWDVTGRIRSTPVKGTAAFEWGDAKHCYIGRQKWTIGDSGRVVHLTLIGGWNAAEDATVEQGFSSSGDAATVYYRPSAEKPNLLEGRIEGVNGPDARWTGTVKYERQGPNEFQLTSTINGEIAHSLRYVRQK